MLEQHFDAEINLLTTEEEMAQFEAITEDLSLLALDIETAYWWDKSAERISLIQLAFPYEDSISVWVIDCFSQLDLRPLQELMINSNVRKVIHNAGFDVMKLRKLANIIVENVYDTMLAARRAGDKGCSLAALASRYLGLRLDKKMQRSDWSRRPLDHEQLRYAAGDAVVTLMLYYKQCEQGMDGGFTRRSRHSYYEEMPQVTLFEQPVRILSTPVQSSDAAAEALIKIVMQFPGRYTPQSLANCLGRERGGLPGWIVDEAISKDAFMDYQEALAIVMVLMTSGRLVDRGRRLSIARPLLSN